MNLHHMCSNLVRVTISVNSEPFLESALAGRLEEEMFSIIEELYQEFRNREEFQDFKGAKGITFPGVLTHPDSLSLENYGQHDIAIFCAWKPSVVTARFEIEGALNEAESAWKYLRESEASLGEDPFGAAYPSSVANSYVLKFYKRCQDVFVHLQNKGQADAARGELAQMTETILTPVNKIVSSMKPDSSDLFDALKVNSALMTGLMTNLQILAG